MTIHEQPRSFTIVRTFDVPPAIVFRAWTHPDHLHWFFNPGMTPDGPATVDLRVGGHWRQQMIIDATTRYVTGGIYRTIVPDEKLVFSWGAVGGWPELDPERPEAAPLATVELTSAGKGTRMDFRLEVPGDVPVQTAAAMHHGWTQTLDRLAAVYTGSRLRQSG